jgi:hypothetical protein
MQVPGKENYICVIWFQRQLKEKKCYDLWAQSHSTWFMRELRELSVLIHGQTMAFKAKAQPFFSRALSKDYGCNELYP